MKRFQGFIGKAVDHAALSDENALASLGVEGRWVPDELEEFDEMEFGLGKRGANTLIFTMVVEQFKLQRVSLGYIPPGGDEDNMHAFSEEELAKVLDEYENTLIKFFERATGESPGT
jgi:hypothetical protein